jgi:Bacterial regulatory proteins, luxR family
LTDNKIYPQILTTNRNRILEELTPKQCIALTSLAAGASNKEAAEAAGVALRTVESWKSNPQFKKMLRVAVNQMFDAALAQLVSGSQEAVKELRNIITNPETPSRTKVTAIGVLLDNAVKVKNWHLEDRLARVEGTLDGTYSGENTEN